MTGEEFRSKYRLADRLTKPPVVTHRATDASGSPVLVHFLMGSESEEGASILEALSQLDPAEKQQIREVIDVDGRQTVVTDVVAGFSTFQEWLDRANPPKAARTEPGAYTQLFKVPELGFGPGSPEEPTPPQPLFPTPDPSATPGSVSEEEAGGSPLPWEGEENVDPPQPEPEPAPQQPRPTDQPAKETPASDAGPGSEKGGDGQPGAYTQIFGRPTPGGAHPPTPGGAHPPTPGAPGGHGAAPPPVRPPAPTVPPAHIPSSEPSPPDWQRWRDTPGAAGRHIPSDDYLQRLGTPPEVRPGSVPPSSGPAGDPGKGAPPPPPAFPGGNDTPSGPGHYTMVREGFSPDPGPSARMAQPARSPASQEPGPKPASMPSRRSSLLTILGLVAVLLTIVALVVVFALVG